MHLGVRQPVPGACLRRAGLDVQCGLRGGAVVHRVVEPDDERLAHFAGKLGRQVGALVDKIERRLS